MSESSISPKPSNSVASALVNPPQITESAARETQQIPTIPSEIKALVEDLETRGVKLREEMEKVRALVAEMEDLLGQLMQQKELAQEQAKVIEELQGERNHFLMLLISVCAGLFFVIFGHS